MKRTRRKERGAGEKDKAIENIWASIKVKPRVRKLHISIRIDEDVVQWFREGGKGYQGRMNAVLRSYMEAYKEEL